MSEEKHTFQAEVAKLLDIVVHSLYSNTEIFLRELISNASDSCDRLRYAALTDESLMEGGNADFSIHIAVDKENRTLTITDNGIGMDKDELVENLGTIAKSGTSEFMKSLTGDESKDVSLIGQFGVGFYSSFMVAKKVEVYARKAGDTQGWLWTSDGRGSYRITESDDVGRGARIVLHLRKEGDEYLEPLRLKTVVKTYSDHIAIPVVLGAIAGEEDSAEETLNSASALWTRPKNEITDEQYSEFYHHVANGFDEPWHTLHFRAEGAIEYTSLLYLPSSQPFDLFGPDRKSKVKLYVNRVFIADDLEGLLPPYLRFVRGVVDSPDLPLNVSREMLQDNPQLKKIQKGLVGKLLKDLKDRSKDASDYEMFWSAFGPVLKEGLYEDFERRDEILALSRFRSSASDDWRSLKDYVADFKEGQGAIYYITGSDTAALKKSPQLEGYIAKGVEVLLLTDPIDEFWVTSVGVFDKHPLRSTAQSATDLDSIAKSDDSDKDKDETEDDANNADIDGLVSRLKEALGESVKEVRTSNRLTESPVCLVGEQGGMSLHLERMLKQHGQGEGLTSPRVLEINPKHGLIKRLANQSDEIVSETAHLLLDQARIVEGENLPDPIAFAQRLSQAMERGLL
ncbi:MAG: molecular chaperone HtpG [Rhodospirillaceae bacterium]|jgi:molecular chaperone HtpG|nr:molecular chaperone HtpG [Rhodospirillaceae bacterium]MBT5240477.1 molecular chaperone HtpG [Rhodospirillaceae bacterium]MBT5564958.1 molecular chaperone HtpG [Rhodospirillaceae bacterium]MBT6090500.1 molecular chaperone HtpG [Rhodospirillaceae bacterium]MBT6961832.1 molecular chaperone HtpG [Rhodospirillaceae bacterium]